MDVIRASGGGSTSGAAAKAPIFRGKVSLMIADLEDRGLVRKIKKGRGNIIIMK